MWRRSTIALAALVLVAPAATLAHTSQQGALQVVHPWVEPAAKGADSTAHPTLINTGSAPLRITRVTTRGAESVVIRHGGKPVEKLTIPAGATLTPDQVTLRLKGLRVALTEGKALPITLHFRDMEAMSVHMAIGRDTMSPDTLVDPPSS